ncbi:hypothetical protein H4S08_004060 [Coemansia sp. RSA 1365]|nr:hypothetical protein H4S08_004060 [Coemansia sp. RSA 1365]
MTGNKNPDAHSASGTDDAMSLVTTNKTVTSGDITMASASSNAGLPALPQNEVLAVIQNAMQVFEQFMANQQLPPPSATTPSPSENQVLQRPASLAEVDHLLAKKNDYDAYGQKGTKFSGSGLAWSAVAWVECSKEEARSYAPSAQDKLLLNEAKGLLEGKAKAAMADTCFNTLEEFFNWVLQQFPQAEYESRIRQAISSGSWLKGTTSETLGPTARNIYANLGATDANAVLIARALHHVDQLPFVNTLVDPNSMTAARMPTFFANFHNIHRLNKMNTGTAQGTSYTENQGAGNSKKSKHKKPSRSVAGKNKDPTNLATNATMSTQRQDAQANNLSSKGKQLKAVADTGAKVCLITQETSERLGLNVRTGARPLLKPLWSDSTPHRALGCTRVNLHITGGPAIWTDAVVIGFRTSWEVLIGDKALEGLGIRLMIPAMQKCLKTSEKQPDHPAKTLDTDWRKEQLRVPSEEEYEKLPESASTHDPETLSLSDPVLAATAVPEPAVSRPMRARLGLPADFFIPQRDAEFERQNALYL